MIPRRLAVDFWVGRLSVTLEIDPMPLALPLMIYLTRGSVEVKVLCFGAEVDWMLHGITTEEYEL